MDEQTKSGVDIVNSILGNISKGNSTLIEVCNELTEDGKKNIKFAVEQRQVCPEQPKPPIKAESPKRAHVFHDAVGFAEYLTKYKTTDTVVFIDIAGQKAVAVINEKAEKGFETVELSPALHPLFTPWLPLLNNQPKPIQFFADFLTANRRSITQPDGKTLVLMLSQVKVSRKITLQRGFGKHCINGLTCEMDIFGQQPQSEQIELPDSIKISVPLYIATEPVEIEVDLTLGADDEEIYVKCQSADLTVKTVEAFNAMLEKVRAIKDVIVTLGKPGTASWDYLR